MTAFSGEPAIEIRDLWKLYRRWHERRQSLKEVMLRRGRGSFEDFWALQGVSFEVSRGESFGVVGSNGSGKSTLLKLLTGILVPTKGEVVCRGRLSALLELGAGFHPELTGRENIYLNGSILGLARRDIEDKMESIIEFSELGDVIDSPIRSYSSGMYVRLGFAVAVHSDPDILLVDEVLAVGDASFQQKSAERILQIRDSGATILVVSHNLDLVRDLCGRAAWIDRGKLVSIGPADGVVDDYLRSVGAPHEEGPREEMTRFGSGIAQIVDVETFGSSPGEPLVTSQPATIRISFQASERIESPVFGLGIFRKDGTLLAGPNTRDSGFQIPSIEGRGAFDFAIENLPLVAGRYQLSVALTDNTLLHTYDHHDRLYALEVEQGDSREIRGSVALAGRWTPAIVEPRRT